MKIKNCYCDGSGFIQTDKGALPCVCLRYRHAENLYRDSGAPIELKKFIEELDEIKVMNFDKYKSGVDKKECLSPIKNILLQFDDGACNRPIKRFINHNYRLYFDGKNGGGKSQAAISLMLEGMKRNQKGYFLSMHTLNSLFQYNFKDEEENARVNEVKKKISDSDILVLDDLGRESEGLNLKLESDERQLIKMLKFLDGVLRERNRFVIITSNMNIEEAKKHYEGKRKSLASILFDGNVKNYLFPQEIRANKKDEILDDLL